MFLHVFVILFTGGYAFPQWHGADPPPYRHTLPLRDKVNKRTVRILLECILVYKKNLLHNLLQHSAVNPQTFQIYNIYLRTEAKALDNLKLINIDADFDKRSPETGNLTLLF